MEDGDETGLKEFLGYVVAAQPLAQLFFRYSLFFRNQTFVSLPSVFENHSANRVASFNFKMGFIKRCRDLQR